jgi:hypothetical protein
MREFDEPARPADGAQIKPRFEMSARRLKLAQFD